MDNLLSSPAGLIPRSISVDSVQTPQVQCFRAWSGDTVLNMRLNLGLRQHVMDGKIVRLNLGMDPSKINDITSEKLNVPIHHVDFTSKIWKLTVKNVHNQKNVT